MLDESVPRRLAATLRGAGRDVSAFPAHWKGLRNGQLLRRVEAEGFACLLTSDKNFRFQQTITARGICLIVLPAQRFEDLLPYLVEITQALASCRPGEVSVISASRA